MPPLECANFLECENKTVCVAPFDLPHGSNASFFHHIPENYHISPCWAFFFFFLFLVIFGQMAWNAIVCETTDVSRETATLPIFQKTWFQAILAKKTKKKKKQKKRENHRVRKFYGVRRSCRVRGFLQYVYVPSCGVRCPRWSAKNLWNAKNSQYAWLV